MDLLPTPPLTRCSVKGRKHGRMAPTSTFARRPASRKPGQRSQRAWNERAGGGHTGGRRSAWTRSPIPLLPGTHPDLPARHPAAFHGSHRFPNATARSPPFATPRPSTNRTRSPHHRAAKRPTAFDRPHNHAANPAAFDKPHNRASTPRPLTNHSTTPQPRGFRQPARRRPINTPVAASQYGRSAAQPFRNGLDTPAALRGGGSGGYASSGGRRG